MHHKSNKPRGVVSVLKVAKRVWVKADTLRISVPHCTPILHRPLFALQSFLPTPRHRNDDCALHLDKCWVKATSNDTSHEGPSHTPAWSARLRLVDPPCLFVR